MAPLLRLLALMVLGADRAAGGGDTQYTVCVVIESGFTMLREPSEDPRTVSLAPEAVRSDAQLRGFDVDLRTLAFAGLNYTVRVLSSYGEVQVRTRSGECDVGWAQFFTLSSRMRCVADATTCRELDTATASGAVEDWTPYRCCAAYSPNLFPFEIRVMYVARGSSDNFFASFLATVESAFFVNFLCFAFLLGCVFSHLLWFVERHPNPEQFPRLYLDGIDDGFWWAAATFTTVGYGDKAPITPAGRFIAVVWMLIGVTLCSILSGHMATSFYARKTAVAESVITTAEDLSGRRVCGYGATFTSWYLPNSVPFAATVVRDNVAACGALMEAGEVDATVMEAPMMSYWMRTDPWAVNADLVLSPALATVPMGVVYSSSSDIGGLLDLKLVELFETASVRDMQSRWFGERAGDGSGGEEEVDWRLLGPSLGLLAVYTMGVVQQSISRQENPCGTCKGDHHQQQQRGGGDKAAMEEGESLTPGGGEERTRATAVGAHAAA